MSEERATFEVVNTIPQIESYRAVGAAVFEMWSDGTIKVLTTFNPGHTAEDMAAACKSAERYAANLNGAWAF